MDVDRGAIEISTGGDETVQVEVLRRVTARRKRRPNKSSPPTTSPSTRTARR